MMNKTVQNYLSGLHGINNTQELTSYTGSFLKSELNLMQFMIVHHQPNPNPLTLVFSSNDSILFSRWEKSFKTFKNTFKPFESTEFDHYFYCFSDIDYSKVPGEFLVSESAIDNEALFVFRLWQILCRQIVENTKHSTTKLKSEFAGLNSQLMHDIQAIIDLTEKTDTNTALKQRVDYQKKVNKNFLFWIRDIELVKSNVPVKDLVISSLQLLSIDPDLISFKISDPSLKLHIDVELFSKAFNEIILNAISAVKNDFSKIEIDISVSGSPSPLINYSWLNMQIRDTGNGIPEDFLPFVFNPFFTTEKYAGHTGFGLPIAKKVFETHGGAMEIKSAQGMGTIVKIYLPV